MHGRSTKQRRAAARRSAGAQRAAGLFRKIAENVRRNNRLFFVLAFGNFTGVARSVAPLGETFPEYLRRHGSRFVCELPRDGFLQKPPKGES